MTIALIAKSVTRSYLTGATMSYSAQQASYIHDGLINQSIKAWHDKQPERQQDCATPSTLTDCPRIVWLKYRKHVKAPIPMGWGKLQRNLLGRQLESLIAEQLQQSGNLLWWWKDDVAGESVKFEMGKGLSRICGTPDLLIKLNDGKVAISDAKTSMGKSFAYVSVSGAEIFKDWFWFCKQLQVESYYMLCHKNKDWFGLIEQKPEATKPGGSSYKPQLPLPEVCHLFSYALDDGICRREFTWKPSREIASKVLYYVKRWNEGFASETMPDCTCLSDGDGTAMKFCYYVQAQETTKTGYKLGTKCCGEDLYANNKTM